LKRYHFEKNGVDKTFQQKSYEEVDKNSKKWRKIDKKVADKVL
jgi:hypothetical protein